MSKAVSLDAFLDRCSPEPNTGCWIWVGGQNERGYGRVKIGRQYRLAHRISHELFTGPIPEGQFVCHRCDNPWCVNPDHLFCGTHLDNMQDCRRKSRFHRWQGERQGAANPRSKLTEEQVFAIREIGPDKGVPARVVSILVSVNPSTIRAIWRGQYWPHVNP